MKREKGTGDEELANSETGKGAGDEELTNSETGRKAGEQELANSETGLGRRSFPALGSRETGTFVGGV